jgi:hypothetical protein
MPPRIPVFTQLLPDLLVKTEIRNIIQIMAKAPPFKIIFIEQIYGHLEHIDSKDYKIIQETILEQLGFTPTHVTRNRKPREPPAPLESRTDCRLK